MPLFNQLVEFRIDEARRAGVFDDLPGAGRPLPLDDARHVPEELRAAYRILKNAGYLPPELELRREITHIEQLCAHVETGERGRLRKRLHYLMTCLGVARSGTVDLDMYMEQVKTRLAATADR